ncbi:MAG: hypothetical protein DMF56_21685 [Acidobacteria bacterium]|nr:MAG: hypothetical protein DMF56_21685 [Acidobacteriota bacterium]
MPLTRAKFYVTGFLLLAFVVPAAHAALTVTPITWNVIGLDSNDVNTGPNNFPVGARVCSNVATTNVSVSYVWDTFNAFIDLRAGSLSTVNVPSIGAGACADAYFEVTVVRNASAYNNTRRYHITATDFSGTASTPTPREVFIEHLISQNRNSISDVKYGPVGGPYTSVPSGGSMALVVGNTYDIQLFGGTATQGYNQFEEFINFPNTIFQITNVNTTYSADNSPYVPNPNNKLYADACQWENDPNSPNYRACVGGDFKAGGSNVVTTYTLKIIGGGGTNQSLGSLLYDFSGSSYHYNADYGTGARIASIIDPSTANIAKAFTPNTVGVNGVAVLTITLTNPNGGALSGYNFVDNLPANLVIATPNGATTSGCGSPTLTATAGSSTISFSNGTVAANGSCVINVNVTPTTTGAKLNTTNNLFVGTTDTGHNASASLTVNNAPPPGTGLCGITLALWEFPTGFNVTNPAPTTASVPAGAAHGTVNAIATSHDSTINPSAGTTSWGANGGIPTGALVTANDDYFEFAIDTTGVSSVSFSFDAEYRAANGPQGVNVFYGTTNARPEAGTQIIDPSLGSSALTATGQNAWKHFGPFNLNTGLAPAGNTYFRVYFSDSGNTNSGSDGELDHVLLTGCLAPIQPTIAKAFAPNPIAVSAVSTLTFTLTNTNTAALTGAAFTDNLPAGVQVAATPAASTTCAGATWAPLAGNTTLTFSGGTIPASGSCTVSVNVTATTAGPHSNVSGPLSTTEGGTNTSSLATATLTALMPPSIAKVFSPSPIIPNGVSTLTFTITNPNQNNSLGGIAFNDTFPVAPGAMVVAATPNATTSGCGAPTFAPVAGAGSISFSGGTIAAGAICTVTVNVTAPNAGTYNNTSGPVSTIINGSPVNGNTASGSLVVNPPNPSIHLLKQVGPSNTGPWTPFLKTPVGGNVFYRFTVENTGDVPLLSPTLTDNNVNVSACNASWSGLTLPVAVPANDNHIITCIVGPISAASGSHPNTASVSATFNGNPVASPNSIATYATTGLTLVKSATQTTFTNAGDTLNYSYLVTNSGFAPLQGPVTVSDDKATVTCPAVTTVGDLDNFLDPGESITCTASYIVTATDVSNAKVTNTATATVDGVNSNQSSKTVPLSTSADVSVTKTLDTAAPYFAGQSITYTITVANAGPSTATNINVTDTPTNLTITNVSGACTSFAPCVIASLASGANTVITVTATINAAGAFDNSTTVSATQPDPNPGNNTDNTGNGGTATLLVDVTMNKQLTTGGPFTAGQSISYTLTVGNNGPSTATSVQVTDTPTNLTITNVSGGGCSMPFPPCTIPSINSGGNVVLTVTATINAAGAFDNSATATPAETDSNNGNNTDNSGNNGTAAASADVSVVKTLTTSGPFSAGQTISYTLTVANAGPSTATNINVTDTPANLTITNVSGACTSFAPCVIASLASGANTVITVTATINATGAFDNSATATGTESDPNPGNNTDNSGNGGTAAASADISVVKTLTTSGPFTAGQSISYTLTVANAGPSTATNVQVTDTPTNLTLTNLTGGGCSLPFPCTIPSINSGANVVLTVTATINAAGAFDNSTTVSATEPDPNSGNNTDNSGNGGTAAASADVTVVKTLTTSGPFTAGQSISYTLTVANAGPSTATNITVTDTPTNLTITNVSGACTSFSPCVIASLASGANTVITVTATINAAGAFDNSATATGTESDPNPGNNTDNSGNGGTAAASADVSVVKTLTTSGPFNAGQSISYTLTVANGGPSTATNITVTDTPTNLTITNVSGACTSFAPCIIASLASGANTAINVTATINASGAFDNVATANGTESDPNQGNNTDNSGNGGTAGTSADVSVVKTLTTVGPFIAGQSISYTLTVANAGPSTATNITVTDTPTNLTIMNVSGACTSFSPCIIASLASGANTVINVTATINASGAFDNSATATGTEPDPNPGNNTDNTGNGGSTNAADISVVKTLVTSGPFTAGQSISYTLTVANAGPATATNINVTDTPTNLTITNVSGACASFSPCIIASLASGANTVINVTATINAAGAFDNSTTVSGTETDPNPGDNTDSTNNGGTAAASADVSVVKTLTTAGPFVVGQSIGYTLTVANGGPSTATNITVTDTPTNLTITNVSGACTSFSPCIIASLASGANTVITVTATINAAGAFDNVATANGTESDPNPGNNTDSTGNGGTAAASADVSVVKTLTTAGPYSAGQSISYTLTVANAGPSTATNVQVTDTPTNLTLTNLSGGGCSLPFPCTIPSINSGANVVLTVTATINAAGAFDNSTTVSATETDPNTNNNSDSSGNGGTAAASADVSMVKTLTTAGPFIAGQSISYTLTVANAGPSTATNINVTDTPANLTITNVSGACTSFSPCIIASLASGANTVITVTATIIAPGAFDNSATATATETDPNPGNNTDNTGNGGSTNSADVAIVKTLLTSGPFTAGQAVSYTLQVTNNGPSTATNVTVTDTPTNLTITNVSGACTSFSPCVIASLASGANTVINVTATINAGGAFDNSTTVSATETDPVPSNNTDNTGNGGTAAASVTVDLALTKTANVTLVQIGQPFDYTLTLHNNGPGTATGVVMTDSLPANFQLQTVTSTQGTCSGTTTVTCTIGTMLNGATVTITIHGTATHAGTLMNTATAAANETETITANNTSSVAVVVSGDGPTLSPLSLMLLALMLTAVAIVVMRR